MATECDNCGNNEYTDDNPLVQVRTRRPSDHSDMCCVMAGHAKCFVEDPATLPQIGETDGIATPAQWEAWIEKPETAKAGFLFLT